MTQLRNAEAGVALVAQGDWEWACPGPDLLLVARPAGWTDDVPAPTVVVTRSTLGELGLDDWLAGTVQVLAEELTGYQVIDLGHAVLSGRDAAWCLANYVNTDGFDLTSQQWLVVDAGLGLTLTVTSATEDFPATRGRAREMAESLTWEVYR